MNASAEGAHHLVERREDRLHALRASPREVAGAVNINDAGHMVPATYESRLAAIARTRTEYRARAAAALVGGLVGSIAVVMMGAWFIAPFRLAIAMAFAALALRVASLFRPLHADLLTHGRITPAVLLAVVPTGLGIRAFGFSDGARSQRRSVLRIEVQPSGQDPYRVVLTTFDGPRPTGLEGRPIRVYVDPADPRRICPDWRTFEAEF